jgi:WD40 repeat protein
MLKKYIYPIILILVLTMTACGKSEEVVLPTLVDIAELQTRNAPTLTPSTVPTATFPGATLPPTYTPTPTLLPVTVTPTYTPDSSETTGTIYYIYNNNAIAAMYGDGSQHEFIYSVSEGRTVRNLTLSPNGELLAFVAPGNGSADEVWIMNRDGTYLQQISCLGLNDLRELVWSPDGEWVSFFGAQKPGDPAAIYSATWINANSCPETQRQLVDADSTALGGLAYSPDGTKLFFSDETIYVLDLATNEISEPLTETGGFGPDHSLQFNPEKTYLLVYLQSSISVNNQITDGDYLVILSVARIGGILEPETELRTPIQKYQWSNDGSRLLISTATSVFTFNPGTGESNNVVTSAFLPPLAIYSPTNEQVAYIDRDPSISTLQQIYVVKGNGANPKQVTTHAEGIISDIIWADGGW